jgi:serine/threonine protein kinase
LIESTAGAIGLINIASFLMTATVLPENYCVCVGEDGAPREISRNGIAVTYKAMGYQSGQAVALQLIPLASMSEAGRAQFELKVRALRKLKHPNIARVFDVRVEDEHLVFATEFLQGETAERWVVTHGPMPADAVLRIGLQVVSALAEAAFHSLSHRAIQPSNLMIVSGVAPDGDWPFVKLLNFGLAGLKVYSDEKGELVPAIGAAFASPEQLEKGKVDFRSEVFSLGATMCFLLTGAVPLAGRTGRSGTGELRLPGGAPIPRAVRRLLRRMLRIDADERPHDPLLLADELQKCLRKVRRRRVSGGRKSIPLETEQAQTPEKSSRWLGPALTAATVLLLLAALGLVLLPGQMRWWTRHNRPLESIGVPVGVDENAVRKNEVASAPPTSVAENSIPTDSPVPEPSASPEPTQAPVVAENATAAAAMSPEAQPSSSPSPPENPVAQKAPDDTAEITAPAPQQSPAETPAEVATGEQTAEPQPPGEAPPAVTISPPQQNVEPVIAQEKPAATPEQASGNVDRSENVPPAVTSIAKSEETPKPSTAKTARADSTTTRRKRPPTTAHPILRVGGEQVQRVGTTAEGNWILRLPSGETVITPPAPDMADDAPVISHRRVRKVKTPPSDLPPDNRPPVVVLPPEG